MLVELPEEKRNKKIHILSSDVLVENPIVRKRQLAVCNRINQQILKDKLPMALEILTPELNDTFWVNLIGRGYPSPNKWFRWCTDRLKIKPMTKYIKEKVKENGEVIIILGTRKSESSSRSHTLDKYTIKGTNLKKHNSVPGAFVYAPLEDWLEIEVWDYLDKNESPWGISNSELKRLYGKDDTEIEFILDDKAKPSGTSRFGCWVCTVVDKDRALESFIDEGKDWLIPLLEFRNWLKEIRNDETKREKFRKAEKQKKLVADSLGKEYIPEERYGHKVLGPFTFETRKEIFKKLLSLQTLMDERGISLITPEEIKAIETVWIYEGYQESSVSNIVEEKRNFDDYSLDYDEHTEELRTLSQKNSIQENLIQQLIHVEKDFSTLSRRVGIFEKLDKVIDEYVMNEMSREISEANENK
jgi:DNA sulfur modification protein DndC